MEANFFKEQLTKGKVIKGGKVLEKAKHVEE